jgi:hypothetical protein
MAELTDLSSIAIAGRFWDLCKTKVFHCGCNGGDDPQFL